MFDLYYFLDHNDDECRDLCISGQDYALLIDTCFKHSAYLSFNIGFLRRNSIEVNIPEPYRIIEKQPTPAMCDDIAILPCTEAVREYLLSTVNDLFEWIDRCKNPEDLTFYRADGSIFFWSLIHEGVCCLIDRPDEDVSSVVDNPDWHRCPPEQFPRFFIPANIAEFKLDLPID